MPEHIRIPNGHITICTTEFNCPKCNCPHTEKDYYQKLEKSKNWWIYKKCKGCKSTIGIAQEYNGDITAWLKSEEKLNESILNNH